MSAEEAVRQCNLYRKDSIIDADEIVDEVLVNRIEKLLENSLPNLDEPALVATLNAVRHVIHKYSPFSAEPVDCVTWIPADAVMANDYNPNAVAPPEMKLLERSISEDGYTQPIVAWEHDGQFEVVDGFHRTRVGKESEMVCTRLRGYLPLTLINSSRTKRGDRIAATIRHNRARGKHQISAMSDIVTELKRRNWTDRRIGQELGMDPDEILRLCQISGLTEMFMDTEFSQSWDLDAIEETDFDFDGDLE